MSFNNTDAIFIFYQGFRTWGIVTLNLSPQTNPQASAKKLYITIPKNATVSTSKCLIQGYISFQESWRRREGGQSQK